MKFGLNSLEMEQQRADCIIIGLFEDLYWTPAAKKLNMLSGRTLEKLVKNGDFQGKRGQTLWLFNVPSCPIERVLLVGCGKESPVSEQHYRKIIEKSTQALIASPSVRHVVSTLTDIDVTHRSVPWKLKQSIEVLSDTAYRFDTFKGTKEPSLSLNKATFLVPKSEANKACNQAITEAQCIVSGMTLAKNLANTPSNICTPTYLAEQAKKLAKQYKTLSTRILEEADMRKLGMNAFLAVSKGSETPPKLICLTYKGTSKKQAPIVFVGKGITFDTGGLSLKPADNMQGMKYDMCGAATVLGVMKAAAEYQLPLHLIGVLAAAENMPSGSATKPEDIVTSLSGQTIEIMNTDAEGRLVLCDALTYCERFKPDTVIDIATLTGAVVIALGHQVSAVLANDDQLAADLYKAGLDSQDRVWQLPLYEEYQDQLKSPFADMSNVGGRTAGAITAACFLSRFTKKFQWAHLDVAGTAAMMFGNAERCATGRPVPLLMQYLINRINKRK